MDNLDDLNWNKQTIVKKITRRYETVKICLIILYSKHISHKVHKVNNISLSLQRTAHNVIIYIYIYIHKYPEDSDGE